MPRFIGRDVVRKDGFAKAAGLAHYVDDMSLPGMLHARTIRSTVAAGTITGLAFDFDTAGFTIVTADDLQGRNTVALIVNDQPCLADGVVRHVAEPIALMAHEDPERVRAAQVHVSYAPTTPALDPRTSPQSFKDIVITRGSLDRGFRQADLIVEGEYRTGHQEHLYIEPNGMLAVPGGGG
ncbi:MAG: molybdopterin-dependent oxidoreductase, partial [Vicinamibacterales bacterium]|nr:molybdopterin-dependent oxidoreductase [Vicinamibacterales bacterium]